MKGSDWMKFLKHIKERRTTAVVALCTLLILQSIWTHKEILDYISFIISCYNETCDLQLDVGFFMIKIITEKHTYEIFDYPFICLILSFIMLAIMLAKRSIQELVSDE